MRKVALAPVLAFSAMFLGSAAPRPSDTSVEPGTAPGSLFGRSEPRLTDDATKSKFLRLPAAPISLAVPAKLELPPPPPPPTPREALRKGVLIVVSLPSQRAFVFKDGEVWDTTEVSTGKLGNETPEGVFPILQKKVHHRSSLYDDAPMPYMQRLTWDGVALHAGRVPGYPASHGCIRLPREFAEKLYRITGFSSTVVMVTGAPAVSAKEARKLA